MSFVPSGDSVCIGEQVGIVPNCPHGPTLLFERHSLEGSRKFYACSACRDRKECSFFQWADEKVSAAKFKVREAHSQAVQPKYTHQQSYQRLKTFKKLPATGRLFCESCQLLLLPEDKADHKDHTTRLLQLQALDRPSHLLRPLENKKANAQYLFSKNSVDFVLGVARDLGYRKLLCVGTPRIHEAVCQLDPLNDTHDSSLEIASLLLDIDHRYEQFYSPKQYCRYNMFNHYFFGNSEAEETFRNFVCTDPNSVLLITDPPFGGLVEVLAHTVKKIASLWHYSWKSKSGINKEEELKEGSGDLPVMLIFPYFMEEKIHKSLPQLQMLDYKIDYENHPLFQRSTKTDKKGSPVRIFTNLNPSKVVLPADEGYKLCEQCQRYVSAGNNHCNKCNSCPSKIGQTYVHCDLCAKCVKPSWKHCDNCGYCVHAEHKCNTSSGNEHACHSCGEFGHKRRECPSNKNRQVVRKRKLEAYTAQRKGKPKKQKR